MAARANAFRFDLSKPTKRGTLMKQGGLHRAFKYRFFILYPGFLVYYDSEIKWKSDLTKGETLGHRIGAIKLKNGTVSVARDTPKGCKFGLVVHAPDPINKRQSYLLNALSKGDRDEWIQAIRSAIPHTKNKQKPEHVEPSSEEPPREEERRSPRPAGIARQDTAAAAAMLASEKFESDEKETSIDDIKAESEKNQDSQVTENRLMAGEQEEERKMTGATSEERLTEEHDEAIAQALGEQVTNHIDSDDSEVGSTPEPRSPTPEVNSHTCITPQPLENTVDAPKEAEKNTEVLANSGDSSAAGETGGSENQEEEGQKSEVESHGVGQEKAKVEEKAESSVQPMELEKTVESSMNIEGKLEVVTSVKVVSPSPTPSDQEGEKRKTSAAGSEVTIKEGASAWTVTLVRENTTATSDSSDDEEGDLDIPTQPPADESTATSHSYPPSSLPIPDTPTSIPDTPSSILDTPASVPDTPSSVLDTPASMPGTPASIPDTPCSMSDGTSSECGTPTVQIDKVNTLPKGERNEEATETPTEDRSNALCLKERTRRTSTPFIEKRGFLYKEGGQRKTWKLRYFVLQPGHFMYYKHSPNTKPLGEVKLKNLQIRYPGVGERKQSFQFTVHTESSWNKRNDYIIAAQSDMEMKDWVAAFKLAGQKNVGSSVSPTGSDEETASNT